MAQRLPGNKTKVLKEGGRGKSQTLYPSLCGSLGHRLGEEETLRIGPKLESGRDLSIPEKQDFITKKMRLVSIIRNVWKATGYGQVLFNG